MAFAPFPWKTQRFRRLPATAARRRTRSSFDLTISLRRTMAAPTVAVARWPTACETTATRASSVEEARVAVVSL
jgi:hypothetical protein